MKTKWKVGAGLLGIFVMAFPACGRKKAEAPAKKEISAEHLAKETGVRLYPGAELIDQTVKTSRIQLPGTDSPAQAREVKVVTIIGAVDAGMDALRDFYANQASNIITEEKTNGQISFLQLANVSDINKAVGEQASPIILVDLRRRLLSEAERLAYQNEERSLKSLKSPDAIQRRRRTELERLLKEKSFIQINIRTHS